MLANLPLSAPQKRLWTAWKTDPLSLSYNINFCYKLCGKLDVRNLLKAISLVLERKGVSRIRFVEKDGVPYQNLHKEKISDIETKFLDVDSENEARELFKEYSLPFNLLEEMPYRQLLFKISDDKYILCMTIHHIVLDGLSGNMLVEEISKEYIGESSDDVLSTQDVLNWSEKDKTSIEYKEKIEEHWSKRLDNLQTYTRLLERNKKITKFSGRRLLFKVDERISCKINELNKILKSTPFITIMSFVGILLHRFTGTKEIAIAYTVNNRNPQELRMIGFHIDMLPMILNIDGNMQLSDVVDQLKERRKKDKKYQFFSTPTISKILRKTGRQFPNVVLNQSLSFVKNLSLPNVDCTNFNLELIDPQSDLLISFDIIDGEYCFEFEYDLKKYDEKYIDNLKESFLNLINDLLANNKTVSQKSVISEDQKTLISQFSAGTNVELITCKNVYELIHNNIQNSGEKIAVEFEDVRISYKHLDNLINNIAAKILENNVVGEVIAICLPRSLEQVLCILASVKLGKAYLPLDPDYPLERLKYILEDSKVNTLISNTVNLSKFSDFDIIKMDIGNLNIHDNKRKGIDIKHGEYCYTIYTSGSTGNPKGMKLAHMSLYNRINWMESKYGPIDGKKVLHKTPYSFDVSIWEIFWPLMYGGTLVIADDMIHKDPIALSDCIFKYKIDIIHFVPSMMNAFIQFEEVSKSQSLKKVFTSGEALNYGTAKAFLSLFPKVQISNLYGPTEASIDVTYWDYDQNSDASTPPIGKPIQNVQCLILDQNKSFVPIGVEGDLYLSGICLTEGYINRDELNSELFVINPFSGSDNTKKIMYRTGDRARFLPDGNIEYMGRSDNQIKIRGLRVELGEIDNLISQFGNIRNSCTLQIDSRIISFLEISPKDFIKEELQNFLHKKLPDFMLPADYVLVNKIQLNPNGKIDRKKILEEYRGKQQDVTLYSRKDESMDLLSEIWADVLNISKDSLNPESNFFLLGGDSLSMLHMLARVQKLGVKISPSIFLKTPKIQTILTRLDKPQTYHKENEEQMEYSLTPIQHWFFENVEKCFNLFSQHCTFNIKDVKPQDIITERINLVLNKYDLFNTYFVKKNNIWFWKKKEKSGINSSAISIDFSNTKISKNEILLKMAEKIDIEEGKFFVCCFWQENNQSKLTLMCHHLLIDVISWNILLDEVNQPTDDLVLQSNKKNIEFLKWIKNLHLESYKLQSKDYLIGFYRDQINSKSKIKKINFGKVKNFRFDYTVKSYSKIDYGVAILTSVTKAFADCLKIQEVVVESESHGRYDLGDPSVDISKSIGWYTSKYPIKYNVGYDDISFLYLLCQNYQKMLEEKTVSFGILQYMSDKIVSDIFKNYSADISFNFLGTQNRSKMLSDGGLIGSRDGQVELYREENIVLPYTLECDCWIDHGQVICNFKSSLNNNQNKVFIQKFENYLTILMSDKNLDAKYLPTPFQREILAYTSLQTDQDKSYVSTWQMEIDSMVDQSILQKACKKSIETYPILSSSYFYEDKVMKEGSLNRFIFNKYQLKSENISKNTIKDIITEEKSKINTDTSLCNFCLIDIAEEKSVLIILAHHGFVDGHSMYLLKDCIIKNYYELIRSEPIIEKEKFSYNAYSRWIYSKFIYKSLAFWKEKLRDYDSTNFICKSKFSKSEKGFEHLEFKYKIKDNTRSFLKNNNITLSTALNSIVGFLLSRYIADSPKILWGNVLSIRSEEVDNIEEIFGPCVNTLPAYYDFSKKVTLLEYLKDIGQLVAKSVENSDVSYKMICDAIKKNSLFNFLFAFQNFKKSEHTKKDIFGSFNGEISSHFDCTFVCEQEDDVIGISAKYNKEFFDAGLLKEFAGKIIFLLNNVSELGEKYLEDIDIISSSEKEIILQYNETDFKLCEKPLFDMIKSKMIKHSNSTAVYDVDGKAYTYNDLLKYIEKIYYNLPKLDIKKYVGVLLPRSFAQVASILSVVASDFCLVGLDSTFPIKKIFDICKTIGLTHIITNSENSKMFENSEINIVNIDLLKDPDPEFSLLATSRQLKEEFFVAYTSGSTGEPKMVLSNERSHINRINWLLQKYPMSIQDVGAYKTKIVFAPSIREILEPLSQGAILSIFSDEALESSQKFLEKIKNTNISRIFMTPSHLLLLLKTDSSTSILSKVKYLEISGETFNSSMLSVVQKKLPKTTILNRYGSTEIASVVYSNLTNIISEEKEYIPAGNPIYNSKVLIVDHKNNIMPLGSQGEILLGGDCCANEYINLDSGKSFITKLFYDGNKYKFFKTGDLGVLSSDGNLIVQGRKNKICKVRGFRINLTEIQNVINKVSFVENCAVIHDIKKQILIAFVKINISYSKKALKDLENELKTQIPFYAMPSAYHFVKEIPQTRSGKIDYIALEKNMVSYITSGAKIKNKYEKVIFEALKLSLSIASLEEEVNFFRLGMSSLSVQFFAQEIEKSLKIKVPVSLIYSHPDIQSLAVALEDKTKSNLVKLNNSSGDIIITLPPAGGGPTNYINIAKFLDNKFLAFENLFGSSPQLSTIENVAKEYINLMNKEEELNDSNFYLIGWSIGGTIAYETAVQLTKLGRKVKGLFLIDPGFASMSENNSDYENYSEQKLREIILRNAKGVNDQKIIDGVIDNVSFASRAISQYQTPRYNGDIVLIKPQSVDIDERNYQKPYNGLKDFIDGNIHRYFVPGNHITMISDFSELIAKIFKEHYNEEE